MLNKEEYESATQLLQARCNRNSDYVSSDDYMSGFLDLPKDEAFTGAIIWDHEYHADTMTQHEHLASDITLETLTKKYNFNSAIDMLEYLLFWCDPITTRGTEYYRGGQSELQFGFYPDPEYWDQIDRYSSPELYELLTRASDEQIEQLERDTDCNCLDKSGDTFDIVQYIGGSVLISCSMAQVIEILNNNNRP